MAILDNAKEADGVRIKAASDSRFILIAGQPLNEPIAQYGPFVMNTNAEVFQAVEDFRAGRFA
jgi:redox-sensitive bicupin YhaK (pirin superfamily)